MQRVKMPPTRILSGQFWCAVGAWLLVGTQYAHGWSIFQRLEKAAEITHKDDYIFPGTLWCGPGNIAATPDDLGSFNDTDACCRTHDHCDDVIPAGSNKYGLENTAPYTRVHCPCDDKFYSCLKEVDSLPSNQVGRIYFTLLNTQCFQEEYPIVKCRTYSSTVKWRCEEYELDEQVDKQWQWFDVPVY